MADGGDQLHKLPFEPVRAPEPGAAEDVGKPLAVRPDRAASIPSGNGNGEDWTNQVADYIVETVDQVRDKTTAPTLKIARAAVYGTFITFAAIAALILLSVVAFRVLNYAIPGHVGVSYLILGGLMARPLMTALSSLMGSDSGVGKFLDHIGNLGAIGCTGLGVIMLLSDCLTSKDGESGTEAATSMLIRVAMVFVIVIMLVVLMQLVGEVKLPNPTG